jgi:hypothetical protein
MEIQNGRTTMKKKNVFSENGVDLLIRGFGYLGEDISLQKFFEMLGEAGEGYKPVKLGVGEPLRIPFSMENAKSTWVKSKIEQKYGSGILFKGESMFGSIDCNKIDNSNHISLRIESKFLKTNGAVQRFITLAKKLFIWSSGFYGNAHHSSNSIYSSGLDYRTCLPGITWMNLFGKPYVKMFGRDVMETAPCVVEEFAENCFMLLTADKPIRVNPDLLKIQDKVKTHLGRDAFDRKDPRKTFLTMEDLKAGRGRPSTEGYRSPDFFEYLKGSGVLNEEGLVAVVNDDGTITTFKVERSKNR